MDSLNSKTDTSKHPRGNKQDGRGRQTTLTVDNRTQTKISMGVDPHKT